MIADGTYTAVLDRFEGDLAVLIVEADGEALDDIVVDRGQLPPDGRESDTVFEIEIVEGELVAVDIDAEATATREQRAQDRFDRLARRPPSRDDDDADTNES